MRSFSRSNRAAVCGLINTLGMLTACCRPAPARRRRHPAPRPPAAPVESVDERRFVDDATTSHVDQDGVGAHPADCRGIEHPCGLVSQRQRDHDRVRDRLLVAEETRGAHLVHVRVLRATRPVDRDDLHAERLGQSRDLSAYRSQPDDQDGLTGKLITSNAPSAGLGCRRAGEADDPVRRYGLPLATLRGFIDIKRWLATASPRVLRAAPIILSVPRLIPMMI